MLDSKMPDERLNQGSNLITRRETTQMKKPPTIKRLIHSKRKIFPVDSWLKERLLSFSAHVISAEEPAMMESARIWQQVLSSLLPEEYSSIQNSWGTYIRKQNIDSLDVLQASIMKACMRAETGKYQNSSNTR